MIRYAGRRSYGYGASRGGLVRTASGAQMEVFSPATDKLEWGGIIEDEIPTDPERLNKLLRLIYLRDIISGAAIDMYAEFPWSEYTLSGVDEKAVMLYEESVQELNIPTLMTDITREQLMMGKVIGSTTWDSGDGVWLDCIIHDPDYCNIFIRPLRNYPPRIDLKATDAWRALLSSEDERDQEILQELDPELIEAMETEGLVPLSTENTIYFPRRIAPYDYMGTSILSRIIPIYAFEKQLQDATLAGVRRKAFGTTHVKMGESENWLPGQDEMQSIVSALQVAEADPLGGVVVTAYGTEIDRLDNASSMWKYSDEWSYLREAKMNALGINDALLSGDQNLSTKEAALSIFIDRLRSMREYQTREVLVNKLFVPVAKAHEIYKPIPKELAHKYRMRGNRRLDLPDVSYKKKLQPIADDDWLNVLMTLKEEGVPLTLRTWASAGGVDMDREIAGLPQDLKDRDALKEWKSKLSGGGEEGEEGMFGSVIDSFSKNALQTTPSTRNRILANTASVRFFKEDRFVVPTLTKERIGKSIDLINFLPSTAIHDEGFVRQVLAEYYTPTEMDYTLYILARLGHIPPFKISDKSAKKIIAHIRSQTDANTSLLPEILLIRKWYYAGEHPDERKLIESIDVSHISPRDLAKAHLPEHELPSNQFLSGRTA